MKKYKKLYYSFLVLEDGYYHQFSEEEDITSCRVWRVNAMTQGIDRAYKIVQKEIEVDLYKQFFVKQEGGIWLFSTSKDFKIKVWMMSSELYPTLESAYNRVVESLIDDAKLLDSPFKKLLV